MISYLMRAKFEDIDNQLRDFRVLFREMERDIGRLEGHLGIKKEE